MNDDLDLLPIPIENGHLLTGVFGRWPSFHDAEVLRLTFDRESSVAGFDLVAEIHVWEMTSEVLPSGAYRLAHRTRAVLRFFDCDEVSLEGFNGQNVIFGLRMARDEDAERPCLVEFWPCYGVHGGLRCARVAVIAAEPYEGDDAGS